ncbi:MAG: hypothetical protein KME17_13200 [Cyanosarcina radialis HA8281-LM2]|jgi:hypothetical protein|nr:hypothetical protein [Cyanosarcina radialis HA8281-LM2]
MIGLPLIIDQVDEFTGAIVNDENWDEWIKQQYQFVVYIDEDGIFCEKRGQ